MRVERRGDWAVRSESVIIRVVSSVLHQEDYEFKNLRKLLIPHAHLTEKKWEL